jgi:hypothetical protein
MNHGGEGSDGLQDILSQWKVLKKGQERTTSRMHLYKSMDEYLSDRMQDVGWGKYDSHRLGQLGLI